MFQTNQKKSNFFSPT